MKPIHLIIMLTILLLGCSQTPTGSTVIDTTDTEENPTKFTIPEEEIEQEPQEIEEPQSCEDQITELEKDKETLEYKVYKISGGTTKLAMEIQFKKDNQKYDDEVEDLITQLQEINDEVKELKNDIDTIKDAIKILEDICDIE